ncbi:MAG: DNA helicase RecQ [Bacteroidia bacterium]|jgi:ATP-dependent DNA helicase RecQ|nr:DNA helicase RecQ [Bacteroidia bacterium]MBP6010152.1 DNA helicase RecQ [Bacteroidia bacterium]MBP7270262.1 DNA helicase RecQ [Bacteroidia bacterium]MBP7436949.1 DNA helicase RecQ [Bacteroidia bacterium]MBP7772857.1 DNA helicase RecQ [Bacteroidia bacterium]
MLVAEKPLKTYLRKYFGFDKFKGEQESIIRNVLSGKDTFVIMPTGGGKSMCYQLPSMIMEGTAIVVSPLIALMKNQVDAMRGFSNEEGIAHFLNSSLNKSEIATVRKDIKEGRTKLLYVAPESLTKEENVEFLRSVPISFFAIDEAHCISEWGHDFRPEYRRLRPIIDAIGKVPIIALTATATPKVQLDIQKNLGMTDATVYKASFNRGNLYYEVRPKVDVIKEIIKFVKQNSGKSGIIYCLSRKKVEEVASTLSVNGIRALPYHAGLDAGVRADTQDKFLMEEIEVIVATIAFGMGIDKPDVRFVIHHDIPKSLEGYYQETGRSGRDGREGKCVTFYSYKDIEKLEKFMKGKPVAEQEVGKQLLLETVGYAETSVCRRKVLLNYFGEQYVEENCGNCDNCLHPKKSFDGKEEVSTVLETVQAVKEKFPMEHIVNVVCGKAENNVKLHGHDQLEIFGEGSDHEPRFWTAIIRQSLLAGLLSKDIETYGTLRLTDKGKAFLKKPVKIMVVEDKDYSNTESDEEEEFSGSNAAAADPVLFAQLKDLRKQIAKQKSVPPFVVFQDPSLEEMAIQYPITMDELKNISGVGAGKATKFGKPFVELIKKYVEENEIDRPMDLVVKSIVNKSGLKVYLIQNIDRKISLNDMATAKGMTLENLLTELETIVSSGTRIDINYYINEVVDIDRQAEVFEYFKSADSDSAEEALRELGENDYSINDIRLMRIKFLSELGN